MIELKYINFLEYSNEYLNVDFHIHDCYEFVYYHKGTGQILTKNKLDASKKDGGFFLKSKLLKDRDIVKESIMYLPTLSACQKNDTVIETFSPNTYCIYEPFVPHAEKHASAPVITTIGFTITDEPAPHPAKYNDVFGEVESMLKKIKDEYFDNKSLFLEAISHYFSIVLLLAKRSVNDNLPQNFPSLEYAKNYIDQYFTTEINFTEPTSPYAATTAEAIATPVTVKDANGIEIPVFNGTPAKLG